MDGFRYDRSDIHLSYDQSRKLPATTVRLWLESISRYVPHDLIETIVDLGCGTGRFAEALSTHFSARVLGIDLSLRMLMTARQSLSSPQIEWIQGSAETIPLADRTADLVFLSMVYHHIQDKEKALVQVGKVLRNKGFLCIRTSTTDSMDSYDWLQFFPSAYEIEVGRAPSRDGLTSTVQANGFELVGHTIVHQSFAENHHEYLRKISLRGLSSLKAIPDDEFQRGLIGLSEHCHSRETGEVVFEDIDLFVFRRGSSLLPPRTTTTHM
jgi:ubiquinone/menaquinone biosynthesis C-methylase UbiE